VSKQAGIPKLTPDERLEILRMLDSGHSQTEVAARFKVDRKTVRNVLRRADRRPIEPYVLEDWNAWRRSQDEATRSTAGDPRHMEAVRKHLEDQRKILGIGEYDPDRDRQDYGFDPNDAEVANRKLDARLGPDEGPPGPVQ
jgi:IS30 family transposase